MKLLGDFFIAAALQQQIDDLLLPDAQPDRIIHSILP
jgi:hypothetical protein